MKTNLQNDNSKQALQVFEMQCLFYGDIHLAYNSLCESYKIEVLKIYPNIIVKQKKKSLKKIEKAKYYKQCWEETEKNAPLLDGIEKRCFKKYDIDHIVPISYGYKNNISPKLIGSLKNLRIISNDENKEKGIKLTNDSIEVLKLWEIL